MIILIHIIFKWRLGFGEHFQAAIHHFIYVAI